MSRSRWEDFLQDHLFWAMDASGADTGFHVFSPLFGFSGISAPSIKAQLESFKDGTYQYPRHIINGGTVDQVTFTRAASMYDSDFYDWIYYAIEGIRPVKPVQALLGQFDLSDPGPVRRDLMIFQFAKINLANAFPGSAILAAALAGGLSGGLEGIAGGAVGGVSATISAKVGVSVGPFAFATWLPARAWTLHGCLPVAYSSGSNFDGKSGQVSLMSLTVQPEFIEEINIGAALIP